MSYTTITQASRDVALQDRVTAAGMKEAVNSEVYKNTVFGEQIRRSPVLALNYFLWPTCTEYETEYEFAVNSDNPDPGGDVGVITDANIQAVVQEWWPQDQVPMPQPPVVQPVT